MRYGLAVLLIAHGIAHLVGYAVPWRLASSPDLPYTTTVLAGHLDIGATGARVVGLVWLVAATAFVGAGALWALGNPQAFTATLVGIALSTVLCTLAWPHAGAGLALDVLIAALLFLLFTTR